MNWLKLILHSQTLCGFTYREPDLLLKCEFEVNKISIKLSNLHKQVLHFWKMIFTHNFSPHGSTLWNNREITFNKKSVLKNEWYEKGILFVYDVLDCNGNPSDYLTFLENFHCSYSEFQKIIEARSLIQLIQNIMIYSNTKPALPKLRINDYDLIDKKRSNKFMSTALKSVVFHDYDRRISWQSLDNVTLPCMEKTCSTCFKWPIPPKVKETRIKIIHNMHPVAEFLKKRFKFEVEPRSLCSIF